MRLSGGNLSDTDPLGCTSSDGLPAAPAWLHRMEGVAYLAQARGQPERVGISWQCRMPHPGPVSGEGPVALLPGAPDGGQGPADSAYHGTPRRSDGVAQGHAIDQPMVCPGRQELC